MTQTNICFNKSNRLIVTKPRKRKIQLGRRSKIKILNANEFEKQIK